VPKNSDDLIKATKRASEVLTGKPIADAMQTVGGWAQKGLKAVGLMDEGAGLPRTPGVRYNRDGSPPSIPVGQEVEKEKLP